MSLWEIRFAPPKTLSTVPYHLVVAESPSLQVSLLIFPWALILSTGSFLTVFLGLSDPISHPTSLSEPFGSLSVVPLFPKLIFDFSLSSHKGSGG